MGGCQYLCSAGALKSVSGHPGPALVSFVIASLSCFWHVSSLHFISCISMQYYTSNSTYLPRSCTKQCFSFLFPLIAAFVTEVTP